jgi:hypothetical protein
VGYADAFSIFAAIGILTAILSPAYPGHIDYWADWTDTETDTVTEATPAPWEEPEPEETGLQAAYDNQLVDEDGEPLDLDPDPVVEEDAEKEESVAEKTESDKNAHR